MTRGEYLVGINFNPSNDDTVGRLKRAAADFIDLIGRIEDGSNRGAAEAEVGRLKALAITQAETAAMWAVKAATKPEPK